MENGMEPIWEYIYMRFFILLVANENAPFISTINDPNRSECPGNPRSFAVGSMEYSYLYIFELNELFFFHQINKSIRNEKNNAITIDQIDSGMVIVRRSTGIWPHNDYPHAG